MNNGQKETVDKIEDEVVPTSNTNETEKTNTEVQPTTTVK